MNAKKLDALHLWKQIDDELVPRLRLTVSDRAAYCYLVRHSRLEARRQLRFSLPWLARGIRLSVGATRQAVRRLIEKGAVRLVERTKAGHVAELRLPEEIRAAHELTPVRFPNAGSIEEIDFLQGPALREVIHARDGVLCFYCLRRVSREEKCIDHVVPRVEFGRNSYRNLVSCCLECNSQKGERSAEHFLQWPYRERRLTSAELSGQLRKLDALAAGKLKPLVSTADGGNYRRNYRSSTERGAKGRATSQSRFIEQKPLDGAEYLTSAGRRVRGTNALEKNRPAPFGPAQPSGMQTTQRTI